MRDVFPLTNKLKIMTTTQLSALNETLNHYDFADYLNSYSDDKEFMNITTISDLFDYLDSVCFFEREYDYEEDAILFCKKHKELVLSVIHENELEDEPVSFRMIATLAATELNKERFWNKSDEINSILNN